MAKIKKQYRKRKVKVVDDGLYSDKCGYCMKVVAERHYKFCIWCKQTFTKHVTCSKPEDPAFPGGVEE